MTPDSAPQKVGLGRGLASLIPTGPGEETGLGPKMGPPRRMSC